MNLATASGLRQAIHGYLKGRPRISAIVGTRVYTLTGPQNDPDVSGYPMIVCRWGGGKREYVFTGRAGIASRRLTIECHGTSVTELERLIEIVVDEMTLGNATLNNVGICGVFIDDDADTQSVWQGQETGTVALAVDVTLWHRDRNINWN